MGKKSDAPPAPDYSPLISAVSTLANTDTNYANQQMGWAENQFAQNQGVTNQVIGSDLGTQNNQNKFAQDIENQYENTYVPLENQFAQEAKDYTSQGNIQSQMGRAEAGAAQGMDQARVNAQKDLESFGISPDATRYAALDVGLQAQKGAAVAAAGNQAYQNTINTGLGLQQAAIGQGEVMPSMAAGTYNTALQAGAGAVNSGLATTASGANTMGTTPQYMNLANGSYAAAGGIMNNQFQNQLASFNANQNASSGWGALGGAILGSFLKKGGAVPDDDDPSNFRPFIDHHVYVLHGHDEAGRRLTFDQASERFFKTGDHVGTFPSIEHAQNYIQQQDYAKKYAAGGAVVDQSGDIDDTQGGGVPASASPSRGAVTDDVPAKTTGGQTVRLNAGEFVIPKDVASWLGHQKLQAIIDKAHQDMSGATAKPQIKPVQRSAVS